MIPATVRVIARNNMGRGFAARGPYCVRNLAMRHGISAAIRARS